jgi:MarR family transcriptional regulator, negative regulator of the multidrug operon emrRAB
MVMGDSASIGRLDFWTFIEAAKTRLGSEFGSDGLAATEVLLTLNRASMAITYDLESAVHRPRGLSWASFRLLFVTWLAGPLEPKKAAELAGVTKAAVSNLAKSLVEADLLTRTPADRDGRSVQLTLTDNGRRHMHALFAEQSDREQAWVGVLTPAEQHILVMLLNKLIAGRTDFDVRTRL